jgi:hypothetical protein
VKNKLFLIALAIMVLMPMIPASTKSLKGSLAITTHKKAKPTREQLLTNPTFKQAVNYFQIKNYAEALQGFQGLDSTGYCCDLVHYYIAQCYQNTNQTVAASQHYNWVVERSTDTRLRSYADYANQTMAYYNAHRTYAGQGNNFARNYTGSSAGGGGGGGNKIGFG